MARRVAGSLAPRFGLGLGLGLDSRTLVFPPLGPSGHFVADRPPFFFPFLIVGSLQTRCVCVRGPGPGPGDPPMGMDHRLMTGRRLVRFAFSTSLPFTLSLNIMLTMSISPSSSSSSSSFSRFDITTSAGPLQDSSTIILGAEGFLRLANVAGFLRQWLQGRGDTPRTSSPSFVIMKPSLTIFSEYPLAVTPYLKLGLCLLALSYVRLHSGVHAWLCQCTTQFLPFSHPVRLGVWFTPILSNAVVWLRRRHAPNFTSFSSGSSGCSSGSGSFRSRASCIFLRAGFWGIYFHSVVELRRR